MKTLLLMLWIAIQMLYLFTVAILFTLPIYVSIQVISWVFYKQDTRTKQKQ